MPDEKRRESARPRDAGSITPERLEQELDRGRIAVEAERVAALGALHAAQVGKIRVLERELARRERRGEGKSPVATALRQRLERLRARSAVLEVRRARACRQWPEPSKDAWILHGFVLHPDGSPGRGLAVALRTADGRSVPGAGAKVEDDGYYRLTIRRDARLETAPGREAPVLAEREAPPVTRLDLRAIRGLASVVGPPAGGQPGGQEPGQPGEPPGQGKPEEPAPAPGDRPAGDVHVVVQEGDEEVYVHPNPVAPRPGVVDYLDIVLPAKGERAGPC